MNASTPTGSTNSRQSAKEPASEGLGLHTRMRIAEAAIQVMADKGLAGVSYRQVAAEAGTSLALVNYYFPSKFDLIGAASSTVLEGYTDAFARASRRFRAGQPPTYRDFALRLLRNASKRDRLRTLAWAEIILDAVRHEESLALAQAWNDRVTVLWTDIADAIGVENPARAARSGIDIVTGLLFFTTGLNLDKAQIEAVLVDHGSPLDHWTPSPTADNGAPPSVTRKTAQTRERILDAAIELLVSDGPAAISFRAVAQRAGLTTAAPAYHFRSINVLLSAAQLSLFRRSIERYRAAMRGIDRTTITRIALVDLTSTILIREATEYSKQNLAFFTNWIEASRRTELRSVLWIYIQSIYVGWQRVMETASGSPLTPDAGILAFALFVGKLIRFISTGSQVEEMAKAREDLEKDFSRIWKNPSLL